MYDTNIRLDLDKDQKITFCHEETVISKITTIEDLLEEETVIVYICTIIRLQR